MLTEEWVRYLQKQILQVITLSRLLLNYPLIIISCKSSWADDFESISWSELHIPKNIAIILLSEIVL
jgi:hypothetical protein